MLTKQDYINAFDTGQQSIDMNFVMRFCAERGRDLKDLNKLMLSSASTRYGYYSKLIKYLETFYGITRVYYNGTLIRVI